MEFCKVIDEYGGFTEPCTVQLTPECFAPACVGDGEVESFGVDVMPPCSGYDMSERIFGGMHCDLRISRCAGSEEHDAGIIL